MINSPTFNATHALSEKLAGAKIGLTPRPNTILAACIEASKTPMAYDHSNDNWQEAWNGSLAAMPVWGTRDNVTLDDDDGGKTVVIPTSLHESTMNEATQVATTAVVTALAAARNVHKPIIADYIDRVTKQIEVANQIVEPIELVDVHLNPAWDEPAVRALINRYGKGQRRSTVPRADIPAIAAPADIDAQVRTGSSQLDKSYAELLREAGLSNADVFNSIFNSSGQIGGAIANVWINRNKMLAQLIFISILNDQPPEGTGMSKSRWETLCGRMILALAYECYYHLTEEESIRENKVLVANVDVKAGKIYLHGAVYDQWLDDGGVPELIYGAYLEDGRTGDIKYDKLLDNKERFLASWRRYHSAKATRDEQQMVTRVKDAMLNAIGDVAKTIDLSACYANASAANLVERGYTVVRGLLGSDWTKDIGLACLQVACDVFFPHTPTKRLLLRINALVNERSMEGEEAAAIATIEYMNDWLAGQLMLQIEGAVDDIVLYHQNTIILANLAELSTRALLGALGGDASKVVEGERVNWQLLADTAVARVGSYAVTFIPR